MTAVSGTTLNAEANLTFDGTTFKTPVLEFKGVGGNSSNSTPNYAIYQESGAWSYPYPDLIIAYHTGIKIGGHKNYNGTRFYNDSPKASGASQIFSVGDGDDHVRVLNDLIVSGTVTANSDITLKKNITTIDNALDKVCNLRGVEFDYIENEEHSIGVIAQEVEKVFPDLIHTDAKTDLKTVAYSNLTAVLIEAVKELKSEVASLKQEIKELKS